MDIKLKYRAWVGEKHADISSKLTNSDIETFAIEFAEWLVKNRFMPDVSGMCEHPWASVIGDGETKPAKCLKCGKYI